jgi:hypothetical protein
MRQSGVTRVGRRQLVLGLGALGIAGGASVSVWQSAAPKRAELHPADLTVFDRRFRHAHGLAKKFGDGHGRIQAIAGDATDLTLWFRSHAASGKRACVRGFTTETVPFCLSQMAPRARLMINRIDQDLFAWTLTL